MTMKIRKSLGLVGSVIGLITLASANWGSLGLERAAADWGWRGLSIGVFYKFLFPALTHFLDLMKDAIIANPDIYHSLVYGPLSLLIKILEPLYVLSILFCGFYLLLMSGSPAGRAAAKALLPRLLVSMVLVTICPYLLEFLLSASREMALDLFHLGLMGDRNIFLETFVNLSRDFATSTTLSLEGGHIFLILGTLMTITLFIAITLRYILITLLVILFPLTIFFYFLDATKGLGRKMLEQTIIWSFTQSLMALIFVVSNVGIITLGLSGNLFTVAGLVASFLVALSPLFLFLIIRRFLP